MKILNLKQGSSEWLAWRQERIGASDTPIILGVSPYKTKRELAEEKLGKRKVGKVSFNMQKGNELEPEIRRSFEAKTGIDLMPVCADSDDHDFMGASFDGLNFNGDVFAELKLNNAENHALAKAGKIFEPHHYQTQKQWFVGRKQISRGFYGSWHNGDLAIVEVEPSKADWFRIVDEEVAFWEMLKRGELPDLCEDDFEMISDDYIESLACQVYEIGESRKALEKSEAEFKKKLIDAVGRKAYIGEFKLNQIERKGAVQYDQIPQLTNVDLEKYRKAPTISWSLTRK